MKNILIYLSLITLTLSACEQKPQPTKVVPGYISYFSQKEEGVVCHPKKGITQWKSQKASAQFFIHFPKSGNFKLALNATNQDGESELEVAFGDKKKKVKLSPSSKKVKVGSFMVKDTGFQAITIRPLSKTEISYGSIESLELSGSNIENIHFNTKPRRNCASVHLNYPVKEENKVEWFYNEVVVPENMDPLHTYFEACGFHRGYFGIQVNSPRERRIIFSVWDSSSEPNERKKVKEEDLVHLLAKGTEVVAHDFGNEGTGGHSHRVYPWQAGDTCRFLLHAEPEGSVTTYTAYFHFKETNQWDLIARFKAPKDGSYMRHLYSFVENFWGTNGHKQRKASFCNQWIRTPEGQWIELTEAFFTHDPTGKKERMDYGGGIENNQFYLFTGGFTPKTASFRQSFKRPENKKTPQVDLSKLEKL